MQAVVNYVTTEYLREIAKLTDFEAFNLYMANSDANLYMDESVKNLWKQYLDSSMIVRKLLYYRLVKHPIAINI
jgi:hypothetical protein